jgi:hypothetical protein
MIGERPGSASLRRLTRAAATVISDITSGQTDLADTVLFVGFDSLFERIRRQVRQLALDEDRYPPGLSPITEDPCAGSDRGGALTGQRLEGWPGCWVTAGLSDGSPM